MFGKLPSSCRYHGNKIFSVEKLKKINILITHTSLLYMTLNSAADKLFLDF